MLEILALVYLTRKIGLIAERKGLKKGTWKLYTVLSWFGMEILGIILAVFLFGDTVPTFALMLVGMGLGYLGYYLVKTNLEKKPDILQDDFDFEQNQFSS